MEENKGKLLNFKFNGARNQIEEFSGEIIKTYPAIFLIQIEDGNGVMKTFSYSDILTESLQIVEKK